MQKVAILGSGVVGETLAKGFLDKGHAVRRGTRDPDKLAQWAKAAGPNASAGSFVDAAAWCELAVLCVKGTAAEELAATLADALAGKLVLDTTNPIMDGAPDHGVLRYFTAQNESLMERLQLAMPRAKLVKCWNSVGAPVMVNPPYPTKPSMFIAGNDVAAKESTTALLDAFGYETVDIGGVEGARPIEALCQLWCAPGFLRNDWSHAFKYLK
jgi:predicted dinucleotide-binding enzyme